MLRPIVCSLLTVYCSLFTVSCNSSSEPQPLIPYAPVNVLLNLSDQRNAPLRYDNGVLPVAGGVRGILVVRQNASSYLAFERNCPYRPDDACARVGVDGSPAAFLRDSCCNSQFTLQGQPMAGPTPYRLRQYSVSLSGNQLFITN